MITHCNHCGAGLLKTWQECRVCGAPRGSAPDELPAGVDEVDGDAELAEVDEVEWAEIELEESDEDAAWADDDPWADVFQRPPAIDPAPHAEPSRRAVATEGRSGPKRAVGVLVVVLALLGAAGAAAVLLSGDDDAPIASPLERACAAVADLDVDTPPDEVVERLKALEAEVVPVAEEGLDPTKDLERLAESAADFDSGATGVEVLGASLHGFVATCDVNDFATAQGTTDLANALESFSVDDDR